MNNLKVSIRPFTKKDLSPVLRIDKLSFVLQPRSGSWFKKQAQRYRESFLVAEVSDKVIGYTFGRRVNQKAKISRVAVDPQYRGEGVGHQLVNQLLSYFKKKKVRNVFVEVQVNNQGSIKFFQSFHFRIKKTLEKYYRDGTDGYLMVLSL